MNNQYLRNCRGSFMITVALILFALNIAAMPSTSWGQFGGLDDVGSTSSSNSTVRHWTSLPLKNPRSERIEQEILAALDQPASLTLRQSRLDAFVNEIAILAGIQIQLDNRALNDANVPLGTPIFVNVENLSLRNTLDIGLRPVDLRWVIRNDMVTVTTKDVADDITEVRVYPVRNLVVYGNGPNADFNTLMDMIQNTIKPDSWTATGGPGTMERFSKNYSLVISQTREVHEQIELLAAQLRRVSGRHGVWGISHRRPDNPTDERPSESTALQPQSRIYTKVSTGGLVRVHQ